MKLNKKELFTIPNILTYIRLLLIPVFSVLYLRAESNTDYYTAGGIILFSGFTDFADGFIARRFHQITELGKAIDPIADKLTQFAILICLLFRVQGIWILFLLFIVKEGFMGINDMILFRKGKKLNGAKWFGKVSTAVFYTVMVVMMGVPSLKTQTEHILMFIVGGFLLLSFVLYIPVFVSMHHSISEK